MTRVIRMLNSIASGEGSWACNQEYLEGVQISSERADEFLKKRLAVLVREEELPEIEEPKVESLENSGNNDGDKTKPPEPVENTATVIKDVEDLRAEKESEIDALDYNAQRGLAKTWGIQFTGNPSGAVLRATLIEEAVRRASQTG